MARRSQDCTRHALPCFGLILNDRCSQFLKLPVPGIDWFTCVFVENEQIVADNLVEIEH